MRKILVLYHYYWPDDVVSAAQFTDLCEGLAQRDWEVRVWPSNRPCHTPHRKPPIMGETDRYTTRFEERDGVAIKRVWRPSFHQHSMIGRVLNAVWMLKYWWLRLLLNPPIKPDVILIGSDPLFSVILAPWLKLLRPKAQIAHWCFDLYPEAAIADGVVGEGNPLVKIVKWMMKGGYQKCDLVADLGSCMRERLRAYEPRKSETLTPWALEEPPEPLGFDREERALLFGDAPLGLLYSGSFGRAHEFYLTLKLARKLHSKAMINYGVRGSRLEELKLAINQEDTNVRISNFAPPEKLSARLCAPDIHIVSLRPEWEGIVVPSKFFGALAVGRPVLFEGPEKSAISQWIKEHQVGWVLKPGNLAEVAEDLALFWGMSGGRRRCSSTATRFTKPVFRKSP